LKHIAVLASGKGTNTVNLIRYFSGKPAARVGCVISDRPHAPVLGEAQKLNVPCRYFSGTEFREGSAVLHYLDRFKTDWIVLAGFLSLLPPAIIDAYPGRVLNIHPALLPRFGGKGMYGMHVHEAVVASGEKESGITIHLVDDRYDTGKIVFQKKMMLDPAETADSLSKKIRALELDCYPVVVERLLSVT
jgi:phosphoribosylglycinamide formyltransferase-1